MITFAEFGLFYFDINTAFPAVVVSNIPGDRLLVRVWTDSGDRTEVAVRGDSPGTATFVANA